MRFNFGPRTSYFTAAKFATVIGMFVATNAFAQTAKVIKVSGKKAIVQFPDDSRPRVGQTIDLGGGGGGMASMGDGGGGGGGGTGSRAMIAGGSAEFTSLTPSGGSTSSTRIGADARYGWNAGVMEYGAVGTMVFTSSTGTSGRILSAGGFFDYNLVPNTPGTEVVYGAMALGKFGQISSTTGALETSGTIMTIEVGGQLKWFPLGNSVAIRGDLLYRMESASDSIKASASSGIVAKGGFYIYF